MEKQWIMFYDKIGAGGEKMTHKETIAYCLTYIENHLDEELTPGSLADRCGYSFHYFCHFFTVYMGLPVGEYIRRRRLMHAGEDLKNGKSVTEAAFDYGFATVSGFSRAFKKEFGICASDYRKRGGFDCMNVKFEKLDEIKVVGYELIPDGEVDVKTSGAYWLGQDFSSVSKEDFAKVAEGSEAEIGLWYHAAKDTGKLSYFFGPVVKDFDFVPEGMITLTIPAAEYAVFTSAPADLTGKDASDFAKVVRDCWKYIYTEWLDQNGTYEYNHEGFAFEYYAEKNGTKGSTDAVMNIYVPVKRK